MRLGIQRELEKPITSPIKGKGRRHLKIEHGEAKFAASKRVRAGKNRRSIGAMVPNLYTTARRRDAQATGGPAYWSTFLEVRRDCAAAL